MHTISDDQSAGQSNECSSSAQGEKNNQAETAKVRALNDKFRTSFVGGALVLTDGVAMLDPTVRRRLLIAVRGFDSFSTDTDLYGEHDFGSVKVDDETYFFKIDYFDRAMNMHSPDKADPAVTTRVMTIMRADEY